MSDMRYVVAVSGGVDSVVLLDMLARDTSCDLVVAHFDHGIRPDSAADARFVAGLAERYGVPHVSRREALGVAASEALARTRRYAFLQAVAAEHNAQVVTAHHLDDLVETIVINLHRGTGWRGLAVLNRPDITRPLLNRTKRELYEYAVTHRLEWVEDETNQEQAYLRNQVRRRLNLSKTTKRRLSELRAAQCHVAAELDAETSRLLPDEGPWPRSLFIMVPDDAAHELLRYVLKQATGTPALTRPQLSRLLLAIKTARRGSTIEPGDGIAVRFTHTHFIVNRSR